MHLPKFEHLRPETANDVTRLLDEYGQRARLAAGGTDLFPRMKYGLERPEAIISLKGIPVKAPELKEDGTLYLDALTPPASGSSSWRSRPATSTGSRSGRRS